MSEIYPFVLYMACWWMFLKKKFQTLEKKISFNLSTFIFFVVTAPITSKGSRNIQGFALIRAVLLFRLSIRM